jgi:hypothetical protein
LPRTPAETSAAHQFAPPSARRLWADKALFSVQQHVERQAGWKKLALVKGGLRVHFKFENNTYVATSGSTGYRVLDCTNDYSAVQMRNNIFYSNLQIANNGNFTHTNNLYYTVNMVNGSGVGYSLGTGEISSSPLFVNLAGGDFHLQITSPAIDTGMDLGYDKDIEDHPVSQALGSLRPDMGAYEYGAGR